jgi:hypothetical protein
VAVKFLMRQRSAIPISQEEYVSKISIALKRVKQPPIDNEERYALIEAVRQWLDKYLKN